jgi:hypothetical protein
VFSRAVTGVAVRALQKSTGLIARSTDNSLKRILVAHGARARGRSRSGRNGSASTSTSKQPDDGKEKSWEKRKKEAAASRAVAVLTERRRRQKRPHEESRRCGPRCAACAPLAKKRKPCRAVPRRWTQIRKATSRSEERIFFFHAASLRRRPSAARELCRGAAAAGTGLYQGRRERARGAGGGADT